MNKEYAAQVNACEIIEKYTPFTRLLKMKYPKIPANAPGISNIKIKVLGR